MTVRVVLFNLTAMAREYAELYLPEVSCIHSMIDYARNLLTIAEKVEELRKLDRSSELSAELREWVFELLRRPGIHGAFGERFPYEHLSALLRGEEAPSVQEWELREFKDHTEWFEKDFGPA